TGGVPTLLSYDLDPLFHPQTPAQATNAYLPVDLPATAALSLTIVGTELWFRYQDTGGTIQVLVYDLLKSVWRPVHTFGRAPACLASEDLAGTPTLLLGGQSTGAAYTFSGTSDDGLPISALLRTGSCDQERPREDKLYGDQTLDANPQGVLVTTQVYADFEASALTPIALPLDIARTGYVLDPFGTAP